MLKRFKNVTGIFKNQYKTLPKLPLYKPNYFSFTTLETDLKVIKKLPTGTGIPTNMGFDHVGLIVSDAQQVSDFLIDVFDAEFDWEVKRNYEPASTKGWDKLFGVHPNAYLKHVIMLKCGELPLTQYIEILEWKDPEQHIPPTGWPRFQDIGCSYISFTVKDLDAVMKHIKEKVIPKYKGVRFIQDPPMNFPLRGEVCTSTFITTPWGMWIELTCWSKSHEKGRVIAAQRVDEQHKHIGKHIKELPTPSLLIDLDIVDYNIELLKGRLKEKGIDWRVLTKAFKCPKLSEYIVNKGNAVGIECLTLTEAELMADSGFKNIYLANVVGSEEDLKRISVLAKKVKTIRVAVENADYIKLLAKQVESWEITSPVEVLVELNINHNRCGVTPKEALELAKLIKDIEIKNNSLIFAGITGYEGHLPILPPNEKSLETQKSHNILAEAKKLIEDAGIKVNIISGGGSCNYIDCLSLGIINELQAGGGAICDLLYYDKANLKDYGHKMGAMLLTTIISVPSETRAMGDAGFKATGFHPFARFPEPRDNKNLRVVGLSAEHTRFEGYNPTTDAVDKTNLKWGDKIVIYPPYSDAMGFLHRKVYTVRSDKVVDVWPTFSEKTWIENHKI
jgi:D-serine deaminase-like pyridoxal phosphate-dependent protein